MNLLDLTKNVEKRDLIAENNLIELNFQKIGLESSTLEDTSFLKDYTQFNNLNEAVETLEVSFSGFDELLVLDYDKINEKVQEHTKFNSIFDFMFTAKSYVA